MTTILPTQPVSSRHHGLTTDQIGRIGRSANAVDLAAHDLARRLFTDVVRRLRGDDGLDPTDVTIVLARQIAFILGDGATAHDAGNPLVLVRDLVANGDRRAASDGRSAAALCGRSWRGVRSSVLRRADEAVEAADRFGVCPMLALAAASAEASFAATFAATA